MPWQQGWHPTICLSLPMIPYSTSDQHISSTISIFSLAAALIRRSDKCVPTSAPSGISTYAHHMSSQQEVVSSQQEVFVVSSKL